MSKLSGRGYKFYLPSATSLTLFVIALGILVLGVAFAAAFGFDPDRLDDKGNEILLTSGQRFGNFFIVVGWFVSPFVALLVQISAWLEKRAVPRASMGCLSALGVAAGAVMAGLAFSATSETSTSVGGAIVTAAVSAICCGGPIALLFLIVVVRAFPHARQEISDAAQVEREEGAIELIHSRDGEASYSELSRALGVSEEEVDKLLRDLLKSKKIVGVREARYQRFYTLSRYAEKQRMLQGMVKSRGQVSLDDLSYELDAPRGLVKEFIYALVRREKFTGYINWDEEMLYSAEADKLRAGESCPNCGGEMGLAGKGVIHCENCGTEIFLAGDA